MASANPMGDVESGERDDRPTLAEQHSPRGDRLASDDPSTPGPDRRNSGRPSDQDQPSGAAAGQEEEGRRRNYNMLVSTAFKGLQL